ncbi:hypothetical protein E2C01_088359 [Portunus trituberculatus]|uniref:Uncharacterized protein n=1 Tax=Portunus trituberculatus TaxID=210409 RepID=A0A5B7JGD4_PORTR|nr:hypothetical protein [Portunus trituberculatus]
MKERRNTILAYNSQGPQQLTAMSTKYDATPATHRGGRAQNVPPSAVLREAGAVCAQYVVPYCIR